MPGQIQHEIDHEKKTLIISVIGEVSGRQALREIPKIWEAHPETSGYHWMVDLLRDEGTLPWGTVREISEKWRAFTGMTATGGRTALVVRDKIWEKLAEVLAPLFPARSFAVFQNLDAARAWLLHAGCSQGT
jgi:hypothetical protein